MKTDYVLALITLNWFKKYSDIYEDIRWCLKKLRKIQLQMQSTKGRGKRKSLRLHIKLANSKWHGISAFSHALSCNLQAKNRRNSDPTWTFTTRFLLGLLSISISGHIDHECLKQKAMKKRTGASLTRAARYLQTYLCITLRHINYWLVAPYIKETCYSKPTIPTQDCMYHRAKTTAYVLVTATKEFN
jgi:hypothetical protein